MAIRGCASRRHATRQRLIIETAGAAFMASPLARHAEISASMQDSDESAAGFA